MALKYSIRDSKLVSVKGRQVAQVAKLESYTLEDIVDMIASSGSGIKKATAVSVFEEFSHILEQILSEGGAVSTPLFGIKPSISGTFEDSKDRFDKKRHEIKLNARVGSRLKKCARQIKTQKVAAEQVVPVINDVFDFGSQKESVEMTPGNVIRVSGVRLKLDPEDDQQGVFVWNDGEESVGMEVLKATSKEILCVVPHDLASGKYQLEVRVVFPNTKIPRKGIYKDRLVVL